MSKMPRKNTYSEAELEELNAEDSESVGGKSVVDAEAEQPQGKPNPANAEVKSPSPKVKPFDLGSRSTSKNAPKSSASPQLQKVSRSSSH